MFAFCLLFVFVTAPQSFEGWFYNPVWIASNMPLSNLPWIAELGAYGAVLVIVTLLLVWTVKAHTRNMIEQIQVERNVSREDRVQEREAERDRAEEQHQLHMRQIDRLDRLAVEQQNTTQAVLELPEKLRQVTNKASSPSSKQSYHRPRPNQA